MKNRELMGTLMIITYFIWKICSSFIADDLTKYTVIALFCIVNIILAFRISTLYHGERIIYIRPKLNLIFFRVPVKCRIINGDDRHHPHVNRGKNQIHTSWKFEAILQLVIITF
jgi:hypothetical protein